MSWCQVIRRKASLFQLDEWDSHLKLNFSLLFQNLPQVGVKYNKIISSPEQWQWQWSCWPGPASSSSPRQTCNWCLTMLSNGEYSINGKWEKPSISEGFEQKCPQCGDNLCLVLCLYDFNSVKVLGVLYNIFKHRQTWLACLLHGDTLLHTDRCHQGSPL